MENSQYPDQNGTLVQRKLIQTPKGFDAEEFLNNKAKIPPEKLMEHNNKAYIAYSKAGDCIIASSKHFNSLCEDILRAEADIETHVNPDNLVIEKKID